MAPVVDEGRLLGVVDRAGIMGITATRSNLLVRDIMDPPILVLKADEELKKAVKAMLRADQWYAPVVSDEKYVGVLGLEHVISFYIKRGSPGLSRPVSDVMSRSVETVSPDDHVGKVWMRMIKYRYAGFPVVDEKGRVLGIVTQLDLLRHGFTRPIREAESRPRQGPKVSDVMMTPPIAIKPGTSIGDAARLMIERDVGRLIVVDDREVLVGIVDREDIVRAILSL